MKILYDHLCFNQRFGGVPRYYVELIKRLPKESVNLCLRFSNNEYLNELPSYTVKTFFAKYNFKGKPKLERLIGKIFSIPDLLKNDTNIYHQTHYDTYAYWFLNNRVKTVTTIHDMNYWVIPEFYPRVNRKKLNQLNSAQKAHRIITVSNNSKQDIKQYLSIPDEKISVIYHGIDRAEYNSIPDYYYSDFYILFVGSRNRYKNFDNLLLAFSLLKKSHPKLQLFCAGQRASQTELQRLNRLGIHHSVKFIEASDLQLKSLYKAARAFVFPSLYEGFGLPILEAMASNCPVVLSNTSCFPEIAQNAGIYFNPHDIENIKSVINTTISDENVRTHLIKNGQKRIEDFSWDKCAMQHWELYMSL